MNEVTHQMFGLFDGKYYAVDSCNRIVIPNDLDYKSNAVVTKIHDCVDEAEIDAYVYHSDLTTESNRQRVAFMKEYLLGEEITQIDRITGDHFVVGVNYTLYNKDGKVVRSGTSEVEAQWCMPIILGDVNHHNTLAYRKGLILDGRIEICIPDTVRYGIRNAMNQHPYILRINEIFALSTNGGTKYIVESGSQLDTADDCRCGRTTSLHAHAHDAHYKMKHHNGLCDANFNSCFVTNAKIGTTIIDHVVTSAKLEAPVEYEKITLCTVPLGTSEYTIKLNHKLKHIIVNLEVFVDNLNEVYDREDIVKLLEYNMNKEDNSDADTVGDDYQCGCCDNCVKNPDEEDQDPPEESEVPDTDDPEDEEEDEKGEEDEYPKQLPDSPDGSGNFEDMD